WPPASDGGNRTSVRMCDSRASGTAHRSARAVPAVTPHLLGVGDALADFVVEVDAAACRRLGVEPGTAAFRGAAELDRALADLGAASVRAAAGGSLANTCV